METAWPELPWREWQPTISTVHLWLQIVGKVRMALAPALAHWWHITLYVTSRGLSTSPIPYAGREFAVDFDFVDHRLLISDSLPRSFEMALEPMTVARFHHDFMAGLHELGIEARIGAKPSDVPDAIPFAADEIHFAYDRDHANLMWRGFLAADGVMREFQRGFAGNASPVHLFWGSFDLATSRYAGPSDAVESAMGWWPSSDPPGPRFYAYTKPEPAGFKAASVRPADAIFDSALGEFTLAYDAVRRASDPAAAVLEFLQSTYDAGGPSR